MEITGKTDDQAQPHEHQGKIFRRAEDHGKVRQDRGKEGKADKTECSRKKRRDGGDGQGWTGFPLLGHFIAVYGRRHGGSLPWDVDDDRGRRSPVHGAVVDRCHHDDRRSRGKHRRQGQQDRYPGSGTDAGQHPDQSPDETAHQRPEEIL
jgi:hypothetical protein